MSFIEDLLTALIAHSTVAFVHQLGHGDSEVVEKVRRLQQLIDRDTTLTGIIRDSSSFMINEVKSNKALSQALRSFFTSSELHAVARQLFASRLEGGSLSEVRTSIRGELKSLLSLYLGAGTSLNLDRVTDEVLAALTNGCQRGLEMAIDKGYLSAHEASSSLRHRVILDELAAIKENLSFLGSGSNLSIAQVDEFEKLFRREVGYSHKFIKPPHFDASKRIPIDKLYVPSDLIRRTASTKDQTQETATVPLANFLEGLHRVVILGTPGGGKSTLISKLAHDLSLSRARITGRDLTPIVVVLRQYGAVKQEHGRSILSYIEMIADADYSLRPLRDAVRYLLLNGRAVVLFDGLDELLDTSLRQRIASDIESFCRAFPSTPVLVTSREIGYVQAPLDETMFEVVRLAPFNDSQVEEYVKKWFAAGGEFTAEHQKERVASFLEESERVSDLRSVPLLLALMCNIYRGEGYIPKNRPDVYAKCAEMLFERWDKSRGIPVALPFDAHLRPAMMHLAHWLYTSEQTEQTVTERQLIRKATEYLWPRKFEDQDQAEAAAKGFVDFCRGRAWVFTDTGLTRDGEPLYQFAHRTFLEYFTASYLVRTAPGPLELIGTLLPRIRKGEWEVVAQLACQIADKQREGGGDDILSTVLTAFESTASLPERWNLISFAMSCLEFIVPAPRIVRSIGAALVQQTLDHRKTFGEEPAPAVAGLPYPSWESVIEVAIENREYLADALQTEIQTAADSKDIVSASAAWEMAFFLAESMSPSGVPAEWLRFGPKVEQGRERIKALSEQHFGMCRYAVGRGILTTYDLARLHGANALFEGTSFVVSPGGWAPVSRWVVSWLIGENGIINTQYKNQVFGQFDKLGELLLRAKAPWATNLTGRWDILRGTRQVKSACGIKLEGRALFAAFSLIASVLEVCSPPPLAGLSVSSNELVKTFRMTFLARFSPQYRNGVEAELKKSGLNKDEMAFATAWCAGEINLTKIRPADSAANAIGVELATQVSS